MPKTRTATAARGDPEPEGVGAMDVLLLVLFGILIGIYIVEAAQAAKRGKAEES